MTPEELEEIEELTRMEIPGEGASRARRKAAPSPRRGGRLRAFLSILAAVILVHWYFPPSLYWPLEYLDTFFHEGGHSLAAVLTGGEVTELVIQETGAGFARTRGGFRPLILSAGYLGPALAGALLLWLNSFRRVRGVILASTGVLILATGGLLGGSGFTLGVTAALGLPFLVIGYGLWPGLQFHLVNLMGIAIGSSSLRGLKHLFMAHVGLAEAVGPSGIGHSMTDAEQMFRITGLPPAAWAALWTLMAAAILGWGLRRALRGD